MFPFHDESQAARISEFLFNLRHLQIPPRMAPHFENGMSYPAFNFYAPFAYWITSFMSLLGIPVISSLKISFFAALLVGCVGMFLLSKRFFSSVSSLAVALLYGSGIYFAVDIFVRGNLAETWYMGLFPLALYFLVRNQEKPSRWIFFFTSLVLFFVFTVHTIFSPVSLLIFGMVIILQKNKKLNVLSLLIALGLSSYFTIPAILESHLTYAKEAALMTHYWDHFLSISQLWSSPWGFAGSAPGCIADGMSFMVGKIQIICGVIGSFLFLVLFFTSHKKKNFALPLFFLLLGIISVFLTTYQSTVIWNLFSNVLAIFQFPWRFIVFITFAAAFFSGYFFHFIETKFPVRLIAIICILAIGIFSVYSHLKYFQNKELSVSIYTARYLSSAYIGTQAAKELPEYFPKAGNFDYWKSHTTLPENQWLTGNGPFEKKIQTSGISTTTLPVVYFPYWAISVNGKPYTPTHFTQTAQPIIQTNGLTTIIARYEQTSAEKTGNILTVLSFITLLIIVLYTKIWNRLANTKN